MGVNINARIIPANIDNKIGFTRKKDKIIKTNNIPATTILLKYSSSTIIIK
jgi:hypothetical protein